MSYWFALVPMPIASMNATQMPNVRVFLKALFINAIYQCYRPLGSEALEILSKSRGWKGLVIYFVREQEVRQ